MREYQITLYIVLFLHISTQFSQICVVVAEPLSAIEQSSLRTYLVRGRKMRKRREMDQIERSAEHFSQEIQGTGLF